MSGEVGAQLGRTLAVPVRGPRGRLTRTISLGAILGQGDVFCAELEDNKDQGSRIGEWDSRSATELISTFKACTLVRSALQEYRPTHRGIDCR